MKIWPHLLILTYIFLTEGTAKYIRHNEWEASEGDKKEIHLMSLGMDAV
jgi:hypothetical protein